MQKIVACSDYQYTIIYVYPDIPFSSNVKNFNVVSKQKAIICFDGEIVNKEQMVKMVTCHINQQYKCLTKIKKKNMSNKQFFFYVAVNETQSQMKRDLKQQKCHSTEGH